jgi:hypothetical protein
VLAGAVPLWYRSSTSKQMNGNDSWLAWIKRSTKSVCYCEQAVAWGSS